MIVGNTYNGDGTTSGNAASNGAAGAWNQVNITTNTAPAYGTLPADTDVHIRSKDAAGADITWTVASATSFGSSNATAAGPINWIIDGGTVWAGIQGVVKHTRTNGSVLTLRANNNILAEQIGRYVQADNNPTSSNVFLQCSGGHIIANPVFDQTEITYTGGGPMVLDAGSGWYSAGGPVVAINPKVIGGNRRSSNGCFRSGDRQLLTLINPDIELTASFAAPIFTIPTDSRIRVEGGRIHGAGATGTGSVCGDFGLNTTSMGGIEFFGTDIPKAMNLVSTFAAGFNGDPRYEGIGIDGGGMGGFLVTRRGYNTSRSDNNPPYLNAAYPGSGLGWAWYVYPYGPAFASPHDVTMLPAYTDTAGAKKITLELLVATTYPALYNGTAWLDVSYWDDATGQPVTETTRVLGGTTPLATSTAGWSAATWGAISFDKKKIELTTSKSIKQNSIVTAVFRIAKPSATGFDILFVDPALQLSAP